MLLRAILSVDNPVLAKRLSQVIRHSDVAVDVDILDTVNFSWESLLRESADLIVVSSTLIPVPRMGSVRLVQQMPDSPALVVLTEKENREEDTSFLVAGCDAVLDMGLPKDKIGEVLTAILQKRLDQEMRMLSVSPHAVRPRLTDFVLASPSMQKFMTVVRKIVSSDASVLILGETGVGKERLARAIHGESTRATGPFVPINCGALPETLLESELFGHEEGAFTGAIRLRRGWFETAHHGTVFLDEIAEMPLHLQVRLLRVLQEREIQRLGGEKSIPVDVRVIAATNRDLAKEVEQNRFRQDLYYRLCVVTLTIPPLRERTGDIPILTQNFIEHFRSRIGSQVDSVSAEALDAMVQYAWPGNVREVMNVIERAMLLSNGSQITIEDLPPSITGKGTAGVAGEGLVVPAGEAGMAASAGGRSASPLGDTPHLTVAASAPAAGGEGPGAPGVQIPPEMLYGLHSGLGLLFRAPGVQIPPEMLSQPLEIVRDMYLREVERNYLSGVLRLVGGRVGEAAARAGIQRRSLYDKMKRHGLHKEDFRRFRTPGNGSASAAPTMVGHPAGEAGVLLPGPLVS
jgi:DNA-binding NtrC family response regulator